MKKLLVIGPGPTAAHTTDVLAAQALAAGRAAGLELVVLASAPATLLADPQRADRTYLEPLTLDSLRRVLQQERPDAVLTTFGGRALVAALTDAERAGLRWLDAGVERPSSAAPAFTVVLLAGEAPAVLGTVEHLDALGQPLLVAPAQGSVAGAPETAAGRALDAARAQKLAGLVEVALD
ncbi:MAG: hypothetical protein K1X89_11330, partial [Myxococcaceae bacterium]|nr:hypothetical protein [Myxococcaceae bacterium]